MAAKNPRRRRVAWMLAAGSAVLTLSIWAVGWLESAELALYDLRLVGATAPTVHPALLPVSIDDFSTQKVGRFPWPRPITGEILAGLDDHGAAVVAGDVLFGGVSTEAGDDKALKQILARTSHVLLAYGGQEADRVTAPQTAHERVAQELFDRRFLPHMPPVDPKDKKTPEAKSLTLPIPEVVETAAAMGWTGVSRDTDGKLRRVPLIRRYGDHYLPSFTLAAAAMYLQVPEETIRVETNPGGLGSDLRTIILPNATVTDENGNESRTDIRIPITSRGDMWVRYTLNPAWFAATTETGDLRTMSAADVILGEAGALEPRVKGKITMVYASYSGNSDYHPTPRSKNYPGGLVQIEAINTIIQQLHIYTAPWWVTFLIVVLLSATLALFGPGLSSFRLALLGLAVFFGMMLAGVAAFRLGSVLIDMVPALLVVALSVVAMIVHRTWIEERERIDLMWTLQVLEKQALRERKDAFTTIRGMTEGSAAADSPTDAVRKSMEYGRFIESLREIDSLPNMFIGKNYKLVRLIDEGGMGMVFLGEDQALGRTVAIKVLTKYSAKLLGRFKLEAKAVGQIDHPNVVSVYAIGSEGDIPYIVMEYVEGRSLSQRIREIGPLELPEALRIVKEVGLGLDAAHQKNIIHRDIKTSNILIDGEGHAKIIDFGIAKFFKGSDQAITGSREILGTADYMSPEQGAGKTLTHKTDIYSLGIVLYRTLTGRLPFRAEDTVAVLLKHMREPLPDITKRRPDVPPSVVRILDKMTAKSPDDRYIDCQELAHDIDAVLGELSPTVVSEEEAPNIAEPAGRGGGTA